MVVVVEEPYPTPKACALLLAVVFALEVSLVAVASLLPFIVSVYLMEWLLTFLPPLLLLLKHRVDVKEALGLRVVGFYPLLGVAAGIGVEFISLEIFSYMEQLLGPSPTAEFLESIFPSTWQELLLWILGIGVSAGICEEVLFRGFVHKALERYWGLPKALLASSLIFAAFHVDPWIFPVAFLVGLLSGYMLSRTGSLYTSIAVHSTANITNLVMNFLEINVEKPLWWLILAASAMVVLASVYVASRASPHVIRCSEFYQAPAGP